MKYLHALLLSFCAFAFPTLVSAHEVYVLSSETILRDITSASPNPFTMVLQEPRQFLFWGMIGVILVSTVFAMSISHRVERFCNPYLNRLKKYAAPIARITLGLCLIASAYNNALYGPELPLSHFGETASLIQLTLYACGILIALGLFTREAAAIGTLIFAAAILKYDSYMLTYANYLGELVLALILGSGRLSVDHALQLRERALDERFRKFEPYAFPILRVLFGLSIAFASLYAKYMHSLLALDVVSHYQLASFFPFPPLFTVLGAFIVEVLIGLFIMVGFEIRHTALFFLFWIFLSLLYFGEAVWPHLVLVGVLLALFCHGYDRYSIQGYLFKKNDREPVL